jgi:hypothetical protein
MEARTMTTQATHTPGPWKEKRKLAIYSADDEPICAVFPAETEERSKADARLIAAAPDLLEALRRARDSIADMFAGMQFHPDHKDIEAPLLVALSNARAAITKAEGRAE